MCDCLITPEGYNVGPLRAMLESWLLNNGLTPHTCIQWQSLSLPSNNCHDRATNLIPNGCDLSKSGPVTVDKLNPNNVGGLNFRNQPRIVVLETNGLFAGANSIRFGPGKHYLLLIDKGTDIHGHKFCAVYDPDVSATDKAKNRWKECTDNMIPEQVVADSDEFEEIIKKMILGEGNELGPLIRYYYYK